MPPFQILHFIWMTLVLTCGLFPMPIVDWKISKTGQCMVNSLPVSCMTLTCSWRVMSSFCSFFGVDNGCVEVVIELVFGWCLVYYAWVNLSKVSYGFGFTNTKGIHFNKDFSWHNHWISWFGLTVCLSWFSVWFPLTVHPRCTQLTLVDQLGSQS